MKTKPFDLEKARKGAELCTSDGRPARIVDYNYTPDGKEAYLLVVVSYNRIGENILWYDMDGNLAYDSTSNQKLFIVAEEKIGWVNTYRYNGGEAYVGNGIYPTKEEAEANATKSEAKEEYLGAFPFTWEE